jgi:uncharacterized SAM-binding protein YcdF (DUF218 family)
MFYTLSKLFWIVAQPVSLTGILILAGILLIVTGWRRLGIASASLAFVVLTLGAWTSVGALLLQPLEDRFARPDPAPAKVAGIIVLGGGLEGGINLARGGYELNSSGDRFVEGAILARRNPAARLLISGGSGSLILVGEGDADTAPRLLSALGVDPSRLMLENRSRNTEENAIFSKELANPQPGETWLLVTSAFHMPRSMALFRKAGFEALPWPVDYRTTGNEGVGFFADNPLDSLTKSTLASREWIGLFAYWWTGKIDTPFPGP